MPRNTPCEHRNCVGGPCQMLTDEELAPSEKDLEEARVLLAEGWASTSNKYRTVARFIEPVPVIEDMVAPKVLATFHGKRLAACWQRCGHGSDLRCSQEGVERRELRVRVFRAFKRLGGPSA